jgi:hypothetical protein
MGTMLMGAATPKPAQLWRQIKTDAVQVRSAAARLDQLAESSGATWIAYDRQWNEIKPPVEDIQMKLARLEAMQTSLTDAQRAELNQIKPLVGEIQSRTEQFLTLLDTPGVQIPDAKFKTCARGIRSEADKLEKTAPAS